VKTKMLSFPNAKAIAAAVPIISFGLGSTLSTILYKGIHWGSEATFAMFHLRGFETYGITRTFAVFAAFYLPPMLVASFMLKKPKIEQMSFAHGLPQCEFTYMGLVKDSYFLRAWLFMFLNISSGLCLIPLAKQMMATEAVGYSEKLMTWVIALSGLMNGGGRFLFAWWSDRLARRVNILLFILGISAGVMMASWWPPLIGLSLLVINACYGAGFSVIPGILADHYGMTSWTNCESFDRDMPIKFLPIKWEKMLLKLEAAAKAGVDKAITFEFSHFMSPNSMYQSAHGLFDRYMEYIQEK